MRHSYFVRVSGSRTVSYTHLDVYKRQAQYFPSTILQYVVKQPLNKLEAAEKYDIKVNLYGGGFTGQSQALRLAIARALVKINPEGAKSKSAEACRYNNHCP